MADMSTKSSMKKEGESLREGMNASKNKKISLFDMRLRKLEAPIFKREEQENPDGWLNSVE